MGTVKESQCEAICDKRCFVALERSTIELQQVSTSLPVDAMLPHPSMNDTPSYFEQNTVLPHPVHFFHVFNISLLETNYYLANIWHDSWSSWPIIGPLGYMGTFCIFAYRPAFACHRFASPSCKMGWHDVTPSGSLPCMLLNGHHWD